MLVALAAATAHAHFSEPRHPPDRALPGRRLQRRGGTADCAAPGEGARQTIIVDNRPAAGGIVGSDAVAKAAPDGHTLLLVASSHTVTPALNAKLPYSTERDFGAVSAFVDLPTRWCLRNPKVPASNLAELVELAKKNREAELLGRRAPAARPIC